MKLTHNGNFIVVGCHDSSIKVIDAKDGKHICQFLHVHERETQIVHMNNNEI